MGTPFPYTYVMTRAGSTYGQETGQFRTWSDGQEYDVPEDVPDGEFRHLNANDYEIKERTDAMSTGRTKNTAMSGKTTAMSGENTSMETEGSEPEEDSGPDEGESGSDDDENPGGLFEQEAPTWTLGEHDGGGSYFALYGGERVESEETTSGYDTVGRGKEAAQAEIDRRNEEGLTPSEVIE